MAFYVIDDNKNKAESYSKEQFLAVLQQAIDDGDLESIDADSAFVSKIKSIVDGATYKIGFCTQAEYNALEALGQVEANAYYIILDDDSYDVLMATITGVITDVDNHTSQITDLYDKVQINTTAINTLKGKQTRGYIASLYGNTFYDANIINLIKNHPHIHLYAKVVPNTGGYVYYNVSYTYMTAEASLGGNECVVFYDYKGDAMSGTWELNYEYFDNFNS